MPDTLIQDRLLHYCRDAYPEARLVDFNPISDGWETEVYAFTLAHDGGQDDLILRLYPGGDAVPKSTREFAGMKTLYGLGYPVPEVLYHSTDAAWLGKPFIIMQMIDGQPMGKIIDSASPEGQQILLSRCCRLFVDLHALDWRAFIPVQQAAQLDSPLAYMQSKLAQWEGYLSYFKQPGFKPILDWLAARLESVPCARLSPLHQDFHANNILMAASGALYVIDWGNLEMGDFRADLAWTLLLSSTYDRPEMREAVLAEYERLSGQPVENIAYFEVLAAARRLFSIVASMGEGAQKLGMRPEAVALMKQQTGHIGRVYAVLQGHTGLSLPEVERMMGSL